MAPRKKQRQPGADITNVRNTEGYDIAEETRSEMNHRLAERLAALENRDEGRRREAVDSSDDEDDDASDDDARRARKKKGGKGGKIPKPDGEHGRDL